MAWRGALRERHSGRHREHLGPVGADAGDTHHRALERPAFDGEARFAIGRPQRHLHHRRSDRPRWVRRPPPRTRTERAQVGARGEEARARQGGVVGRALRVVRAQVQAGPARRHMLGGYAAPREPERSVTVVELADTAGAAAARSAAASADSADSAAAAAAARPPHARHRASRARLKRASSAN